MAPELAPEIARHSGSLEMFVILGDRGEQLVDDQLGIFVVEGVVLDPAVGGAVAPIRIRGFFLVGPVAGVDEDGDRDRHLASVDQVVEDGGNPVIPLESEEGVAVEEDHQGGGLGRVILGGDVDPVVAGGVGIDLAGQDHRADELALGDAGLGQGVGSEAVGVILRAGDGGRHDQHHGACPGESDLHGSSPAPKFPADGYDPVAMSRSARPDRSKSIPEAGHAEGPGKTRGLSILVVELQWPGRSTPSTARASSSGRWLPMRTFDPSMR